MKGSEQAMENPGQAQEMLGSILQEESRAKSTRSSIGQFYREGKSAFTELLLCVRCHAQYFAYIMCSSFQTCEVPFINE